MTVYVRRASPGLGEQFAHIAQAHFAAVEQVFILAIAIGAAAHNHFVELDREEAIGVVEREVHFGHARARPAVAAGEDQVFGLLRPQCREDLFAQAPSVSRRPRSICPIHSGRRWP